MRLSESLLEQLQKVALEAVGFNLSDDFAPNEKVYVGDTHGHWTEEMFCTVMEWWVNYIDKKIDKATKFSKDYVFYFESRGFYFKEFSSLFDLTIKEDDFKHFRVFSFLGIRDEIHRKKITTDYKNNIESYYKLLSLYKIPIWDFFLQFKMPVYFPKKAMKRHTYIVSETGSGKSQLMSLMFYYLQHITKTKHPKTKQYENSLVLLDPHGDLAEQVFKFVLNKGRERVIYIDPYVNKLLKTKEEFTCVINPFDLRKKTKDNIKILTQELVSAFVGVIPGDADFSTQMQALLAPCIATLLRMNDTGLRDLQIFMDDNNNERYVKEGLKSANEDHRRFFAEKFFDSTYKTTKSSIYTRLQTLLNYDAFSNFLNGKSTINLQSALNSGKVLIFNLAKGRGEEVSSAIGKLMFAMMQSIALRRVDTPEEFRKPTYLFIDEFQNFINPKVRKIITELRKYGLHLVLSNQVVGQEMDTDTRDTILGNTALKIVGNSGVKSARLMHQETHVPVKVLQKTPKFNFHVYNKDTLKPALRVKTPTYLLNKESRFYLSDKEFKELLHYMVYESGYYRKIEPTKGRNQTTNNRKSSNNQNKIKPKFKR